MIVNIGVCGKFHYWNFVKYISDQSALGRFYYSHKLSTTGSFMGIPEEKAVNVWIKEYLIYIHLRMLRGNYTEQFFPLYNDLWQLLALIRWEKCDIFHFMIHGTARRLISRGRREGSLILGEAVNSHPRTQFKILEDEYENLGLKKKPYLSLGYQRHIEEVSETDHLLVPSSFVKESFIQNGYDASRIHLIPFGVELKNFYSEIEKKIAKNSIFRAVCVAQITPRKGQIYLLEAWKKLKLPEAELLLIGRIDPIMYPILDKYRGLYRHIESVPHTELQTFYNQSSVFVLPSVEDGFGYVLNEALACGLPIIATTNTGAPEVISHGKEGFIVPIRSSGEIASSIEKLYLDPMLQQQMSSAAIQKSKLNFGWRHYASDIYSLYEQLLGFHDS